MAVCAQKLLTLAPSLTHAHANIQAWAGIDMPPPSGDMYFPAMPTEPAIVGLIPRFNFETFQVQFINFI